MATEGVWCQAFQVGRTGGDGKRLFWAFIFVLVGAAILAITPIAAKFIVETSSAILVATIDFYLIFLLVCTAVASSQQDANKRKTAVAYLPTRPGALLFLFMYLVATINAFAAMYLATGEIGDDRVAALYFSAVTMTTLGYGEIHPAKTLGQVTVIAQLFNTFVLLIAAIPLLVGRLTSWSDEETQSTPSPISLEQKLDDRLSEMGASIDEIKAVLKSS